MPDNTKSLAATTVSLLLSPVNYFVLDHFSFSLFPVLSHVRPLEKPHPSLASTRKLQLLAHNFISSI